MKTRTELIETPSRRRYCTQHDNYTLDCGSFTKGAQKCTSSHPKSSCHDDVNTWKHFPRHWPLCGEFTGHRWIPKVSDAELWCFLCSRFVPIVEQTMEMPVIWDAMALIMTSLLCYGASAETDSETNEYEISLALCMQYITTCMCFVMEMHWLQLVPSQKARTAEIVSMLCLKLDSERLTNCF